MAKILVTGGNGFIGSHLVDRLLEKGYEVKAFDIAESKKENANAVWFKGDLTSFEDVKKASEDVDGIVHLAAVSRVSSGFKDPLKCINVNVLGTANVLEAARSSKKNPWVIIGSSREVHWLKDDRQESKRSFKNITNLYGISKLASELFGERYAEDYNLKVVVLRFGDVYGSSRDIKDKAIPKLILRSLNNEGIIIDNNIFFDFIHIEDLITGILSGINHLKGIQRGYFQDFDISSGSMVSLEQVAHLIVDAAKSKSKVILEDNKSRNNFLIPNIEKAKKILNFEAQINIKEGIKNTVMEYKQGKN